MHTVRRIPPRGETRDKPGGCGSQNRGYAYGTGFSTGSRSHTPICEHQRRKTSLRALRPGYFGCSGQLRGVLKRREPRNQVDLLETFGTQFNWAACGAVVACI